MLYLPLPGPLAPDVSGASRAISDAGADFGSASAFPILGKTTGHFVKPPILVGGLAVFHPGIRIEVRGFGQGEDALLEIGATPFLHRASRADGAVGAFGLGELSGGHSSCFPAMP